MASMTDYLESKLLDHVVRNVVYTPPTSVYVALFTTPTTDAGGGTEVVGGAYARQFVTFSAASTAATALGSMVGPFTVSGMTLIVSINAGPNQTFTFTGTDPLTASTLAAQINGTAVGFVASNSGGSLRLTTSALGEASSILIGAGTSNLILGFTNGALFVGTDGITSNSTTLNWATATADWGTVTHAAVFDAVVSGNMMFHGPLSLSRVVNSGDTFKILATKFKIVLN